MAGSTSKRIETPEELEFAVFCIEGVASRLGMSGSDVYRALAVDSSILSDYIVPFYDVLHTQGRVYVVDEVIDLMDHGGVAA